MLAWAATKNPEENSILGGCPGYHRYYGCSVVGMGLVPGWGIFFEGMARGNDKVISLPSTKNKGDGIVSVVIYIG